jgi:hypothetical protein
MNITIYGWTTRKPKVLISFIFVSVNLLVRDQETPKKQQRINDSAH